VCREARARVAWVPCHFLSSSCPPACHLASAQAWAPADVHSLQDCIPATPVCPHLCRLHSIGAGPSSLNASVLQARTAEAEAELAAGHDAAAAAAVEAAEAHAAAAGAEARAAAAEAAAAEARAAAGSQVARPGFAQPQAACLL